MSVAEPFNTDPFLKAIEAVSSLAKGRRFVLSGLFGSSSKAYLVSKVFCSAHRPILAVLPDEEAAEEFSNDLRFFLGDAVLFYPSTELLPFEVQPLHPDIAAKRISFLHALLSPEKPFVAVTAATNLIERVMPKEALGRGVLKLSVKDARPREELLAAFHGMGYERMGMVEGKGEMSLRGGILDIHPPTEKYPIRMEFFGDEIESIRTFDPVTQRSQRELKEALILPAKWADLSREGRTFAREKLLERVEEIGLDRPAWEPLYNKLREGAGLEAADALLPLFHKKLDTVFDYLPEDAVIVLVDPSRAEAGVEQLSSEIRERATAEKTFVKPEELYCDKDRLASYLAGFPLAVIEPLKEEGHFIKTGSNLDLRQDIALKKDLSPLKARLGDWLALGFSVYITAHNRAQAERMRELLDGFSTVIVSSADALGGGKNPAIKIAEGTLSSGFRFPSQSMVMVTEEDIFGERVKRRPPPSNKLDAFLSGLKDLSEGDFIVHADHGIGLYRGMERLSVEGVFSDFLLIEYRDSDRLYLPVERMDLVSKYHGVEGKTPPLDKLGGTLWEKKRARVRRAVREIAGDLLALYGARASAKGFAYSPPGRFFTEFEAGFEYEETPDQEKAIAEVMKDMGSARPMDRLICGDVGYGKTEVAMRAAMRAALDSKQAAVLVPTTVLAQQHFLTFKKRFAPYPVTVDVLSRFRSRKEQGETIGKLAAGKVDIIIGTHRLLQKDVGFKNLGLIVIDEEHRFGVRHKERLKELKKEVDVLVLTATPIPRTLHMAMADVRDLSVINTPPQDRLAITTRIIRFDEAAIKEAVEREIKRGGQVFFVHNRVETIGAVCERLSLLLSEIKPGGLRIAVAHGQMREDALEKVMLKFINREYDVLLSTTIIESGLDIPSANTIIINRADTFGLAELYQLRGRVGRSSHRAYAYLICPEENTLTPEARKRMEVVMELSDLGGGFRVAAYDLEIRGAGEILGAAQSGHIAEVGFNMYTELLEETVREMKGETIEYEPRPEINLGISAYIPEDYVPDTAQRLSFYRRLSTASSGADIELLKEEVIDRYGGLPDVCGSIFDLAELRLALKSVHGAELSRKGPRLYLAFSRKALLPVAAENTEDLVARRIIALAQKGPERFRFTPDEKLIYNMRPGHGPLDETKYLLQELGAEC
ncbi:MAG: transcription-repair coupling factor [Deltaproteobacteria bacterium]|nr:transcription-repair coupling factor [Deltaproteobacteria bacterium]